MGPQKHAFHGGGFFRAIGEDFQHLERSDDVISADVLDAWYDPAPGAISKVAEWLPFLMRTSPPTHADGLKDAIARHRRLDREQILIGSGTSSLMYLAFPHLVAAGDAVTLLDPMYGEYRHIFQNVIGCQVRLHELQSESDFRPSLDTLASDCVESRLLVMVNPNSPTGVGVDLEFVKALLLKLPPTCRLWIDETYVDFAPAGSSAESLVKQDPRLIIAKSMSKFYGLSGLRIGYLVASPDLVQRLEPFSPPWSVGLIGQVAAVEALKDRGYYAQMAKETAELRDELTLGLGALRGVSVYPSVTNFVMFRVGDPGAQKLVDLCKEDHLHLRNCDSLSPRFANDHVRTAVKDAETNRRILDIVRKYLG